MMVKMADCLATPVPMHKFRLLNLVCTIILSQGLHDLKQLPPDESSWVDHAESHNKHAT